MKKFFNLFVIITILLLPLVRYTPSDHINVLEHPVKKNVNLFVEEELRPLLDTFLFEAKFYKYSAKRVFYLDTIQFAPLPDYIGGQTSLSLYGDTLHGKIEINNMFKYKSIYTSFIFYHELGHWLGLKHDQGIIMTPGYDFSDTLYTNLFSNNWNILKLQYFQELNKL